MAGILVIGCGNPLRGDDALGPRIAAAIAERRLPGVRVLTPHQLAPELAADLAQARRAIFVDASSRPGHGSVELRSIEPSSEPTAIGHLSRPGELLALAQALYGRRPPAWLVTAPAQSFDIGAPLSAGAEKAMAAAIESVASLCHMA